jgi:hypothetical protein
VLLPAAGFEGGAVTNSYDAFFGVAALGLALALAVLCIGGLAVAVVYRRLSGATALIAVAFGLKLLAVLVIRFLPVLLLRLRVPALADADDSIVMLSWINLIGGVLNLLADGLLVFGLAAVFAACRRRLGLGVRPGDEEPDRPAPWRARKEGGEGIQK